MAAPMATIGRSRVDTTPKKPGVDPQRHITILVFPVRPVYASVHDADDL